MLFPRNPSLSMPSRVRESVTEVVATIYHRPVAVAVAAAAAAAAVTIVVVAAAAAAAATPSQHPLTDTTAARHDP